MRAPKARAKFSKEIIKKINTIKKFLDFFPWFIMQFPILSLFYPKRSIFPDFPWFENVTLKFADSPWFSLTLVTLFTQLKFSLYISKMLFLQYLTERADILKIQNLMWCETVKHSYTHFEVNCMLPFMKCKLFHKYRLGDKVNGNK